MCGFAFLGLAGAAISAAGSIAQGAQANAMAQAQSAAYQNAAENEQHASAYEAMQTRHQQSLEQARARAQVGASGVAFQGSPSAVLSANAGQDELDAQAILYGSTLRQNQLYDQAAISEWSGQQAQTAGIIGGVSNFVSGISSLYDPSRSVQLGKSMFA